MNLPEQLKKYIDTRDAMLVKKGHYENDLLINTFSELVVRKEINFGGRASCGGKTDLTWTAFMAWQEIVRKARKLGFEINVESIKQKNGSPTRSGGFWDENKYTLISGINA